LYSEPARARLLLAKVSNELLLRALNDEPVSVAPEVLDFLDAHHPRPAFALDATLAALRPSEASIDDFVGAFARPIPPALVALAFAACRQLVRGGHAASLRAALDAHTFSDEARPWALLMRLALGDPSDILLGLSPELRQTLESWRLGFQGDADP
jgi:hypothetical protein